MLPAGGDISAARSWKAPSNKYGNAEDKNPQLRKFTRLDLLLKFHVYFANLELFAFVYLITKNWRIFRF
jgi:hypothetical protein